MSNNVDNAQLQNLLNTVAKHLQTSPEKLRNAAQSGNLQENISNLSQKDADKIQKILSDKEATSKLLSTPKAQQLLKKLMGEQ